MHDSKDQELVDKFIDDLVDGITKEYSDNIDFIILYGSAAKGEFIKGASDIDLAIQLKNEEDKQELTEFSTNLFWELDEKHELGFKEYLANAESGNRIEALFRRAENKTFLYTPIFVLGPNDLDWEKGRAKRKDWRVLSNLFISTNTIFLKFKEEGKVLYGRDIRPDIYVNLSFWERWKGICIPVYFSLFALLIFPISRDRSVKYSVKSLLWGTESALLYLKKLVKSKDAQVDELKKQALLDIEINQIVKMLELEFSIRYKMLTDAEYKIVKEALQYKRKGFNGNLSDALWFVLRTIVFIFRINSVVLFRSFHSKSE